jgi:hypothetical protein
LKGGDLRDALKSHINILAAKGFKITKLISDGRFSTLTEYIHSREIIHETLGAGSHVSIVENKIKCIKNRARSILASLPYHLPVSLYPHLIYFETQAVNMVITKNYMNQMTPFENFMGRKIDYKTDLKIYFGQYVRIFSDSSNKLEPRTSGAIALLPSHNLKGTITFYDLNTLRIVKRDKFIKVPITDEVI